VASNWYEFVLTYTPSNSAIYVNGQLMTANGLGATNEPNLSIWTNGFTLGCSWDGIHQANGAFDELETFNYALAATNIFTDYENVMGILAADGLPAVIADQLGLPVNAVDTDCDGLPDWWEVANGLNPRDPTDATPALLAAYASGGGVTTLPPASAARSSLFNFAFVTDASHPAGASMTGGIVRGSPLGSPTNDTWNFLDIHSDYLNGVPALNASSNTTDVRFHSYIGPCVSEFVPPPEWYVPYVVPHTDTSQNDSGTVITNVVTFSFNTTAYLTGYGNSIFLNAYNADSLDTYNLFADFTNGLYSQDSGFTLIETVGDPYFNYFEKSWVDTGTGITYYDYVENIDFYPWLQWWYYPALEGNMCASPGPPGYSRPVQFYFDNAWNEDGPYFSLSPQAQGDIEDAFEGCTLYANSLGGWIAAHNIPVTSSGSRPVGCVNCYLSPFATVSHSTSSLTGNDGASWWLSGDRVLLSTNVAGGWFKNFYPQAQRTVLISGLPAGNYAVLVYFDSSTDIPWTNGTYSKVMKTPNGTKYWYANMPTASFPSVSALGDVLNAEFPVSLMNNHSGEGYIQFDVPYPELYDGSVDFKILGVQLARLGELQPLQARPGNNAVYLNWNLTGAVGNYTLSRSVGDSNSFAPIATLTQTSYQDTNVTAWTTYFYKVTSTDGSNGEITSPVVSAVPFTCLLPVPPRLDFVMPLDLPNNNGTYTISFQTLMTNSDAFDPQGYPLTFQVDKVVSGSLMINGAPFSAQNCTISNNVVAIWTPPPMQLPATTPAFRVYAYDGVNRSTNSVNVFIKQHPDTYLLGWGYNVWGTVGNGFIPYLAEDESGHMIDLTAVQGSNGLYPRDPRWRLYSGTNGYEVLPQKVLDIGKVLTVDPDFDESVSAVTPDGRLWLWGTASSPVFGKPMLGDFFNGPISTWQPSDLSGQDVPPMYIPSPIPFQMEMTDVRSISGYLYPHGIWGGYKLILKNDGTLWSVGANDYSQLGRDPEEGVDLYTEPQYGIDFGMLPGRIEIDGNNSGELTPGRKFVETETGWMAALARCEDGSVWSWGDVQSDGYQGPHFRLGGNDNDGIPLWQPERVTSLDIPGAAPIVQMSVRWNHYIVLRQDGSVSELGYIPSLDPLAPPGGTDTGDPNAYTAVPSSVLGLPANVTQISAGWTFGAALTDDGKVWVWGNMEDTNSMAPRQIKSLHNIVKIVTGYSCVLALDNSGFVWGWGLNPYWGPFFGTYPTEFNVLYGDFDTTAVRVWASRTLLISLPPNMTCSRWVLKWKANQSV